MRREPLPMAKIIYADAPCDRIDPRKQRIAGSVRMPYSVYTQPGVLEHVLRVRSVAHLAREETIQARAQQLDQLRCCRWIGLLIPDHELFGSGARGFGKGHIQRHKCPPPPHAA